MLNYKKLSNLMLIAGLLSGIFYSFSYPYIYVETVKAVSHGYISFEQIFPCITTIVICKIWNKYSNKLFRFYRIILWTEVLFDIVLFADVLIRNNLKFYFLFNVIIYGLVTRNLSCGGVKMRAIVNPSEELREKYDNNNNIMASLATLIGSGLAIAYPLDLTYLFLSAFVGNIIDNLFYLYIFRKIRSQRRK